MSEARQHTTHTKKKKITVKEHRDVHQRGILDIDLDPHFHVRVVDLFYYLIRPRKIYFQFHLYVYQF